MLLTKINNQTTMKGNDIMSHTSKLFPTSLRTALLVGLAFVVALSVTLSSYNAAPVGAACGGGCVATMSATPGSGTYNPDNTVTVSIYVNSGGQSVNAVQADLSYTSSRLQFQGIDASGSAFSIDAPSSGGGGSVSIARGNVAAISGSALLVARVNFKVLSNAGSAAITFGGGSTVASSSTNQDILGSTSGAAYLVAIPTPPPTPPAPGPTNPTPPSPTNNNRPSTPTPSATTPTPTPSTPSPAPSTPSTTTTPESASNNPTPTSTNQPAVTKPNSWVSWALIAGSVLTLATAAGAGWWFLRRRNVLPVVTGGAIPTESFITGPTATPTPASTPVEPNPTPPPTPFGTGTPPNVTPRV